ncbi:FAD/NAD(P)-binding domain-containing protein [Cryphonectria parasitica EP155]|uniref:FAD/NAD(P)-binding domain-containing protein n=1 Tax=Cryphonectria parasitica (strain ATCC 38755 / EP155) TaxID=660469 RepID=A0A9P4XVR9_CRYP1|nr:FAD/NAD(P)-binding domain-containing protein [Cryphonectria parasitica EP155]KAF3761813.1 FAD/NAD(P)-binding domain-containing protein [Cryphonectria parasitica EP155]
MPLRILIIGAGVAGPALATMLLRSPSASYSITIIERAPHLRTGGQQVDLRAQGIPIIKRMGLLPAIQARCQNEKGLAFVDTHGVVKAMAGRNDTGSGPQGFTSEFEIMRGDLVQVLVEESLAAARRLRGEEAGEVLRYEFGKHATHLVHEGDVVRVTLSDGTEAEFDLVVGADGQASRTRRMLFGEEASRAAFRSIGVYSALFNIPRDPAEEDVFVAKMYLAPGKRWVATRTGALRSTQASLSTMAPTEKLVSAMTEKGGDVDAQAAAWEEHFRGAGWQTERVLDGLKARGDFYAYHSGQIKLDRWHKGRVVLVGDAGYCPSPNTGMGTTAALVGCYVLAGELAKHDNNVDAALQGYEDVLRPFIKEAQTIGFGMPGLFYWESAWAIWLVHLLLGTLVALRIDKLLYRIMPEDNGGWEVPDYPKLNLGCCKGEAPLG